MSNRIAKKLNTDILLVTDSADEQANVQRLLARDFGSILASSSEPGGVDLFRKHHPRLVILAFETVSKSEQFYLSLYSQDKQIYSAPHKTLLLCKGVESQQAYELCTAGILDDYVADRPLFDPFRLNLSVSQALKHFQVEQNSFWLSQHIEKITSGMHQFNHFIKDKIVVAGDQQKDTMQSFQRFTKNLSSDLKQLEHNLISMTLNEEFFNEENGDKVAAEFDQFRRESIEAGQQQVLDQLNKSAQWKSELDQGLQGYQQKTGPDPDDDSVIEILLVDDDDLYREMVITMLNSDSVHIMAVSDGESALHNLLVYKPDVILLDYLMPGMDGISVLKQIKSDPATREIPVIMLTGDSSRAVVGESIQAGASKFIVKPSDRKTILSKIRELIRT